jgi:membrane-anchored protein YejM (alkaline phosphatase superfamily)
MVASENGYFDSLALVDLTLGRLRLEMERAGTWDETLVIVTSDHSWRYASDFGHPVHNRIPFLCHFPGQKAAVRITFPVNTLCTHDAILAYLRGELGEPAAFTAWVVTWMKTAPPIPKVTLDPDAGVEQNRG